MQLFHVAKSLQHKQVNPAFDQSGDLLPEGGAGFLDERFFIYSEESELCLRIKQAGWRIVLTGDAGSPGFGIAIKRP
jgi:hypothetical protein